MRDCQLEKRKQEIKEAATALFHRNQGGSLLLYPEISSVYVEFLWEKRRRKELAELYVEICKITVNETESLLRKYNSEELFKDNSVSFEKITEIMNGAILEHTCSGLWKV